MPRANERESGPAPKGDGERLLYCLVPADKPNLRDLLDRHFRDFAGIRVVAERRGLDRRTGEDRRLGAGTPPRDLERRRINPEPERRRSLRRARAKPVRPPVPLPPEASPYADEIVFVERQRSGSA